MYKFESCFFTIGSKANLAKHYCNYVDLSIFLPFLFFILGQPKSLLYSAKLMFHLTSKQLFNGFRTQVTHQNESQIILNFRFDYFPIKIMEW